MKEKFILNPTKSQLELVAEISEKLILDANGELRKDFVKVKYYDDGVSIAIVRSTEKELKEYQYTQKWQEIGLPFEEVKDYLRNFKGVYAIDGEVYSGMESGGEVIVHEDGMRTIMSELIMIWDEKYIPDNCETQEEDKEAGV